MSSREVFIDAVRDRGDLAGVFEYDGETGYFYLYDLRRPEGQRILGAIHIVSGNADFLDTEVAVRWNQDEQRVGLFIAGDLWAVFDGQDRLGGNYKSGARPAIPGPEQLGFNAAT